MMNNAIYLNGRMGIRPSCCSSDGVFFLSAGERKTIALPLDIDKIIDAVVKSVHEGDPVSSAQNRSLIQDQYSQLREAVKTGTGNISMNLEYGTVNQEMAKNLQYNVGTFAAFKNHDMMGDVARLLKDDTGKTKGYSEFRKDALAIIGTYRESWLQVEYNIAVRSSRMATLWTRFQADKHLYPNLRYTISKSVKKREDHLILVGTILSIDHPFWLIHLPPLGYGCECGVENTDEQPTDEPPAIDIPEMFAFNSGIEGKVFDIQKHPYGQVPNKTYQAVAKQAWGALASYERKQIIQDMKEDGIMEKKIPVKQLPAPVEFNRNSFMKNLPYDSHFFDKLSILKNIDEVLKDSEVLYTENRKDKQHVKQYHVLSHTTKEGKKLNLHIEERNDGRMFLYYIFIQKHHK